LRNFKIYIKTLQKVLTIPEAIKLISVDYTYSSDFKTIKKKFLKHYQSDDRLLIIVLTGQKSDSTVQNLNDKLQLAVKKDQGSNHLENIRIITSEQYGEFLGFDLTKTKLNQFEQRFKKYQDLSFNLFHDIDKLFGAMHLSGHAKSWLDGHNEDWINIYFPQR